jgi:hypothetical protein
MIGTAKSQRTAVTRLKPEHKGKNLIALVSLLSICFSGLTLLLQMLLLSNVISIAKKPAPSLVQLSDGQAIKVQAMGNKDRSLDVVQRFTTDSLILLMSWTNDLPGVNGSTRTTDRGAIVKTSQGEKHITTSAFQASFVFSDELRDELVKILAEMTPPGVFKGEIKTALKFQHVTIPVAAGNGQWKINVVATLIQYQLGRGDTVQIPFNKEILVKAIDTPSLPKDGKFANEIEGLVYSIRQAGLEIIAMKDLDGAAAPTPAKSNLSTRQQPTSQPTQKP